MPHHITRLIEEGEHQQLDFKFEVADSHKIARTLVAFANTDGGRLLIGIKDNGSIAGIRSEEEYYMVEVAAKLYCNPPVHFTVKEWNLNKKTVLEVTVPRSASRPHFAQQQDGAWKAYHRLADQNFIVNRILLRVWKEENKPRGVFLKFTEPEKWLLAYLEEHPSITQPDFASLAGISARRAETILVKFILLKMIRMEITENHVRFLSSEPPTGNTESEQSSKQ